MSVGIRYMSEKNKNSASEPPLFERGQGRGRMPDSDTVEVAPPEPSPEDERLVRNKFLRKFLSVAGRIPFADDLASAWYCALDAETPVKVKGVLFAALAYFVIPTDALPDVIAGLGFTDDATVLATTIGLVGMHIREPHRRAARRLLGKPEPKAKGPVDE